MGGLAPTAQTESVRRCCRKRVTVVSIVVVIDVVGGGEGWWWYSVCGVGGGLANRFPAVQTDADRRRQTQTDSQTVGCLFRVLCVCVWAHFVYCRDC